jgi:hypothetical protein
MSELHALDPRLGDALRAWRQESVAHPRPAAMASARAAMHQARIAQPQRRPRIRLLDLLTPGRLLAGAGGLAAALAAVAVLGWNAPAGTPFHLVRLAHEDIALVVPGADRTGLDLAYAEARLSEVRQGSAPAALDEAARLLDDAHGHLPADHASPLWARWQDDVHQLDDLRAGHHGEDGTPGAPALAPGGATPSPEPEHGGGPGPSGGPPAAPHDGGSAASHSETRTESHTFTSTHSDGHSSSSTTPGETHSSSHTESGSTTSPHE